MEHRPLLRHLAWAGVLQSAEGINMGRTSRWLRHGVAMAAVLAATIGVEDPAMAGTIGINGTVLTAIADDGSNILTGTVSGFELDLTGALFTSVTPGCTSASGITRCSLLGITEVRIDLAGGNDVLDLSSIADIVMPVGVPPPAFLVLGGWGNDVLQGSSGNINWLWGGLGDDVLLGASGGANCLDGGAGSNVLINSGSSPAQGCGAGTEPVFTPAQPTQVPEPNGFALVVGALAFAGFGGRKAVLAPTIV